MYLLSGAIVCLNLLSSKLLFERNPELNCGVLLVFLGALSCVILTVHHFTQLKHIMIDSVDHSCVRPLVIRVITGNFALFALFMATKYFSLTATVMVMNCAPFVSVFWARPLLGEKVSFE